MKNKVLIINATISSDETSYSQALKNKFLSFYKEKNINDEIIEIDLNNEKMAKTSITKENFSNYFNEDDSDKYINQLKEVNKLIVVSTMHNFNIPSILKNYLDHVLVANKTFSYKYSKKGDAIGLLKNLSVQILTTQGAPFGWYLWGNNSDYLKGTFEFMGCDVKKPILFAGTKVEPISSQKPNDAVKIIKEELKKAALEF